MRRLGKMATLLVFLMYAWLIMVVPLTERDQFFC